MICERPNALSLLRNLGRRIGFELDGFVGHCDPVKELSLRLLPNSPRKDRAKQFRALVRVSQPPCGAAMTRILNI